MWRRIATISIVIGVGALALAPQAAFAHPAKTRLTIAPWSRGLLGAVDSNRNACLRHRPVEVFKQTGSERDPSRDRMIGRKIARKGHGISQWSIRKGNSGSFYAMAPKRDGCRAGFSDTYTVQPRGDIPPCPSTQPVCHFEQLHLDLDFPCESFTFKADDCRGDSTTGKWPWNASDVTFGWHDVDRVPGDPDPEPRNVYYRARTGDGRLVAALDGTMRGPSLPDYVVTQATAEGVTTDTWYTPANKLYAAGQLGGPLFLKFDAGCCLNPDVYVDGYLYLSP